MTSSATWVCAVCGEHAAEVVLLAPDERDPRLGDPSAGLADALSDIDRVSVAGGPVSITISINAANAEPVADALRAGDVRALFAIDHELAPFWCPECEAAYCAAHYRHWDVTDDGFFDSVRGVCPRGHERMLID